MSEEIQFVRLVGNERRVGSTLAGVSRHWQDEQECFLFVCPHDDDVVIGAGLLIQLALKENVPVHILLATDGSMGYCSMEQKDTISEIRRKETFECYESLGVLKENIVWLGFPDCQLHSYQGRREARPGDKAIIENFTGLQNAFTYYLRKIRPTQCFVPTSADLHPDHKIVHEELLISLYHSIGEIWPELGKPLARAPYLHEMAIYCGFPESPQLRISTPQSYFEKKIQAIRCFRSQKQIEASVELVKKAGAQEYIRELQFRLYDPNEYTDRFKEKDTIDFIH